MGRKIEMETLSGGRKEVRKEGRKRFVKAYMAFKPTAHTDSSNFAFAIN